jgi:hypothetical protein
MFAMLFNPTEVEGYELDLDNEDGDFEHLAGGDVNYTGAIPEGCRKSVHLFFTLDLADPRVGVEITGLDELPLFYALGNCGGPFCYRALPGFQIQLLSQPYPKQYRAGILKDYPDPFPPSVFDLEPIGYDPHNPEDVYSYGGVLGIAGLSARDQKKLRKELERFYRENLDLPLLDEDDDPDMTLEEIAEAHTPFPQGMPREKCPNPECANHTASDPLPVLLFLRPDKRDTFYDRIAGADSGQLLFQVCHQCGSVVVTNPCT